MTDHAQLVEELRPVAFAGAYQMREPENALKPKEPTR